MHDCKCDTLFIITTLWIEFFSSSFDFFPAKSHSSGRHKLDLKDHWDGEREKGLIPLGTAFTEAERESNYISHKGAKNLNCLYFKIACSDWWWYGSGLSCLNAAFKWKNFLFSFQSSTFFQPFFNFNGGEEKKQRKSYLLFFPWTFVTLTRKKKIFSHFVFNYLLNAWRTSTFTETWYIWWCLIGNFQLRFLWNFWN